MCSLNIYLLRNNKSERTGRGVAIDTGSLHSTLRLGDLGRGNHLHRLGDLSNVLDRVQAKLDYWLIKEKDPTRWSISHSQGTRSVDPSAQLKFNMQSPDNFFFPAFTYSREEWPCYGSGCQR